jgi:hypothetical protein
MFMPVLLIKCRAEASSGMITDTITWNRVNRYEDEAVPERSSLKVEDQHSMVLGWRNIRV